MYTHATCTRPDHTTTHAHTPHALTHYTQSRLGLATGSFDFRPLHTTGDCTAAPFCVLRPKIPEQKTQKQDRTNKTTTTNNNTRTRGQANRGLSFSTRYSPSSQLYSLTHTVTGKCSTSKEGKYGEDAFTRTCPSLALQLPVTLRRTHATPFSLLHLLLLLLLFYSCGWKLGGECEHTQIQKALYIVQYMIRSYLKHT